MFWGIVWQTRHHVSGQNVCQTGNDMNGMLMVLYHLVAGIGFCIPSNRDLMKWLTASIVFAVLLIPKVISVEMKLVISDCSNSAIIANDIYCYSQSWYLLLKPSVQQCNQFPWCINCCEVQLQTKVGFGALIWLTVRTNGRIAAALHMVRL